MTDLLPKDYTVLLNDIKQRIRSAQYEALKAVNKELISLYWDIGGMIVERQKGEGRGKSVVERLPVTYKQSSLVLVDSQHLTCGASSYSTKHMHIIQNSHQWCEKLAGHIIS